MLQPMETKMKEFETEWSKRCKDIETIELSPRDAEIKRLDFEIDANTLRISLTTFDIEEFESTIDKIRWAFGIALVKAQTNFRDKETKRLKKAWGQ